ncbi:hypothetical protein LshimejAT787_0901990 [Lyophyllum shimeji]|uniref:Uncharacterized protein n=1 Tax=Lyophyllum shimeji TaxID=47721 RepID=A0A9P3PSX6_LYOSH|nr:hypothetical protein LshimejAT787_0901990 [Lyophyllum shimeji]
MIPKQGGCIHSLYVTLTATLPDVHRIVFCPVNETARAWSKSASTSLLLSLPLAHHVNSIFNIGLYDFRRLIIMSALQRGHVFGELVDF